MVIYLIIIGAAAGYLATRLMNIEANPVVTIAIGIIGALIGGILLRVALVFLGLFAGLIGAVLGAVLLILIVQWAMGRNS